MIEWLQLNETTVWWLVAISVATFALSLIAIPWLIVQIPSDYFVHNRRHVLPWAHYHPVIRLLLLLLKNSFGLLLVAAGVVMLVLPGQGLFTILIGMTLINFPGKYRLERWLASRPPLLRSINWLRQRAGHRPLEFD
jgi:hypothetical protein